MVGAFVPGTEVRPPQHLPSPAAPTPQQCVLEHEIIAHFVTSAGTAVRSLRLSAQHNPSPATVTPQGLEIIAQVYPEGGTSDIPKHKASPDAVTPHSPDDDTEIVAQFVLEDPVATRLLVWLFAHSKVPLSSTPHIFSR